MVVFFLLREDCQKEIMVVFYERISRRKNGSILQQDSQKKKNCSVLQEDFQKKKC